MSRYSYYTHPTIPICTILSWSLYRIESWQVQSRTSGLVWLCEPPCVWSIWCRQLSPTIIELIATSIQLILTDTWSHMVVVVMLLCVQLGICTSWLDKLHMPGSTSMPRSISLLSTTVLCLKWLYRMLWTFFFHFYWSRSWTSTICILFYSYFRTVRVWYWHWLSEL